MKIEDLEKALQYFVIAVPENEEQAKAYFWARKGIATLCSMPECAYANVSSRDKNVLICSGWISVKDRLPEHFEPVLICREKNGSPYVEQGYKDVGEWWKVYGTRTKQVTHWMPLPEPPEVNDYG